MMKKNQIIHSVGHDEEYDLFFVSTNDSKLTIFQIEGGKGYKDYLELYVGSDTEITSLLLGK